MSRRLVAVLFIDLVGWTSLAERLDAEPLQQFLERYYDICVTAVDRHGGIVEKFIGDAIMAVFGAEWSGEDDGLRALRAALQTRSEVSRLAVSGLDPAGPGVHCGIAAGEALVTRSAHAGVRIVGDVVNLAARLQSAAQRDEILLNEVMVRLVRSHAVVAPMPPMKLKGKREPVPVWRAVELADASAPVRTGVPFVDREAERTGLVEAYRAVTSTGRAQALMVLGPPGIGKTGLVHEAVERLLGETPTPLLISGACQSFAATGSYGPLGQMLDALLSHADVARQAATIRGGRVLEVLAQLRTPTTADGEASGPGTEEISWAVRELLACAATDPLALVWEDLQWAEPALLGIIADLADRLLDHPVLMICVARQELRELPPRNPNDGPDWQTVHIGPLGRPHTLDLVGSLMARGQPAEVVAHDMDVVDRIVDDCAGNPLFAELMVETLALGYSLGDVPPSITALVGAMVDRLPPAATRVLEVASVIGTTFTREQLATMAVESAEGVLDDLVRRNLIACARPGEYRFAQQPVHDVVYGRLDKRQRLDWHRELARQPVNRAFHLEAAVHLLRVLAPDDPELPELAQRATSALLSDGTTALRRRNLPAAIGLLRRAQDVPPGANEAAHALVAVRLSDALLLGGDLAGARAAVERVIEESPGSRAGVACRIQLGLLAVRSGQDGEVSVAELTEDLRHEEADQLSWCRLDQLHMLRYLAQGRFLAAEQSARAALRRAEEMNDGYERDRLLAALCEVGQWSPTPIPQKLAFCGEVATRFAGDRCLLVPVLVAQARLLALAGRLDAAAEALAQAHQSVMDLRLTMAAVLVEQGYGAVAAVAGEHERAERHYRSAAQGLEDAGHRPAALAVRALAVRERVRWRCDDRAVVEIGALRDQAAAMDLHGRLVAAAAAARVVAESGQPPDDEADEVLRLLARTDDPCLRGDVLTDLALAHRRAGDGDRARRMAQAAADSYAAVGASLPGSGIRERS
ncbi:AAA family ATPase [Rugosimonospora acidiphila]|uniref:AAA family ATPase n=1 Tax=Rugosimonospora acidiphila TaxID=556531 RepID=A0ABP9SEA8_9ACTN